jgi:hypothetical protein
MFWKKKDSELEQLKKENEELKRQLEMMSSRFAKQWENFLSYDGTKQEGKLGED